MGRPGRAIALACLLVAVCAGLSLPSQAAPAASAASVATSSDPAVAFQIDPAHSGGQPSDSLSPPLSKQWDLDLHGPLTYPLIANGRAFVIANGGVGGTRLYALDLKTGTALWGPIDLGNRSAAAAYDAGRLFTVNEGGMMQALDATTGQTLWLTALPQQYSFSTPPTALNGTVYTAGAGSSGTLYAVTETGGDLRWRQSVANGDQSSPVVTANAVYVSYACQQTYAFSPNGSSLWHHGTACSGGGGATAALSGGRLYVRDAISGNVILDASNGNVLGSFSADAPPAFDGSQGYYLFNHTIYAEDSNQLVKWTFAGDGLLNTSPVVANGTIYEGSASGNLYALDSNGSLKTPAINVGRGISGFSEGLSMAGLAVGDGSLLVPAGTHLVAYSNGAPAASPSPTPAPSASLQTPTGGLSQQVTAQVDNAHTGFQAADSTTPPLTRAWSRDLGGGASTPVIADGKVFVSEVTRLHAINLQTGVDDWAVDLGDASYVAYADSRVYAITAGGWLKAFSSIDGMSYWSMKLSQYLFDSPPTVSNGVVYVSGTGGGGTVYAVDQWTGELNWSRSVENGDRSSPAVSSDGVYVSYACRQTYAFDPKQGTPLWHTSGPCAGGGGATVALYQGRLYVRDFITNLVQDAATGAPLRSFAATSLPAFDGSLAFFLAGSTLQAEDVGSGAIRWTFTGDGRLVTSPVIANGYVYVGSSSGTFYAVSALTGQQIWSDATGVAFKEAEAGGGNGLGAGEGMLIAVAQTRVVAYGAHVQPVPTATPIAPVPPGPPTNVTAVAAYGSASVRWTAPTSGTRPVTSYTVQPFENGTTGGSAAFVTGNPLQTSVVVDGLKNGTFYTFKVWATSSAGTGPASAPSNAVRPMLGGSYHPLPPARLLDTRFGIGGPAAPLASGQTRVIHVTDQAGVPPASQVSAVILNVTVTDTPRAGFLTVYPAGAPKPITSNLNWARGQTVANLVEAGVSAQGDVVIYGLGSASDVIFDLEGWVGFASNSSGADGLYNPSTPARILDTRDGTGTGGAVRPLGADQTITLQVAGSTTRGGDFGGVPATGVAGVILNVTATNATAASYLTIYPADTTRPIVSNLNFAPGRTVPNRVMVKLSSGTGQVKIYNPAGSVDVIADVAGWFTDSTYPLGGLSNGVVTPFRFLDTRDPNGGGPLQGDGTYAIQILDQNGSPVTGIDAVVFNVTATNPTAPSYLTLFQDLGYITQMPNASDLNFVSGQTVPNLVVVRLGTDATFDIYNAAGSVDVVLDIVGVFGSRNAAAPSATFRPHFVAPRYSPGTQPIPAVKRSRLQTR